MIYKIALFLLIPSLAQAFTLNNSIGARFKDNKVKVRVGINPTACTNVDLDEVASMLDEAVDDFWNTVPTSRLTLEAEGSYQTGDNTYRTGELCLIGGSCGGAAVPAVTDIVVTCNENSTNFPNGSSLLALTLPNVISGKDIKGAVVLINDRSTSFNNLERHKKVAVIAHEIGHALGLGHSDEKAALMYYSVVPKRESLGQDDIAGITYLYAVQMDMFGYGCFLGSLALGKDDDDDRTGGGGSFWATALFGLLLALLFKPKRSNAASSLA